MLPQRNVEMIAELVNWLHRSLTSREIAYAARYFNRTWEFGRTRSGCVKYSQELIRQAEGQLPLDIGDLVSACTTEVDLSQKVQALSKSDNMSDSTGKVSGALVTKPFQTWQKKSAKFANHEKTSYPPVLSSIGRAASAFCGTSRQTFQHYSAPRELTTLPAGTEAF
eukprot:Em0107g7a